MGSRFKIYFSDFFGVTPEVIAEYGAFNISLINDLPLFVDPFLLFHSENPEYQQLHADMISYVRFLKTQSGNQLSPGALKMWFYFPEIKENWLGYSKSGNGGRGLGKTFARVLKLNLTQVFKDFGNEVHTGTHLEKLTLVKNGIGKDQISDFTCNLICGFLAKYTEEFAKKHIHKSRLAKFNVPKVYFDSRTKSWAAKQFLLPKFGDQFVLLTPVDILTKDEAWISHRGFVEDYSSVMSSIDNDQLRSQINTYFTSTLPLDATQEELETTLEKLINKFPVVLDYYIRLREKEGSGARVLSSEKLKQASDLFLTQLKELVGRLDKTKFYQTIPNSFVEGLERVKYLKDVIEKQDGYKLFLVGGKPLKREADLQIMFKLTWFASAFDANAEVNNGRGPADFVVSYGSADKTIIEFKLASNNKLEGNLLKQAEIYTDAARATHPPIKAILYFSMTELAKVQRLLKKHGLERKKEIVLIDAIPEKASASKA
ncbi:hypothetical protein FB599_1348 [Herbaspirillum sp. SJZ130]|nr:hypothetical protein FB599_1348 [Herbaspirillum sp. SJZ130]TQK14323.1 hypothetical protein FB598_1694 [Herbaspirillum sp. SJZ106]